eukprot:403340643
MELNQDSQIQQEIVPYTQFFSWGSDQYGQLALANQEDDDNYNNQPQFSDVPKSLSFDIIIKQISCGENHAGFISGDSFVFCVGRNQEGQLGVGDPALFKSSAPLLVDGLPKDEFQFPIQISCGGNHSAVVMKNGDLYTWGQGAHGATGLLSTQNTFAPIKVEFNKEIGNRQIAQVSCGKKHTIIVDINGKVMSSGDNTFRQLGIPHCDKVLEFTLIPDFQHRAKLVDAGVDHSLILTLDNNIYGAGNNKYGNLGLGHTYSSDSFLLVHGLTTNLKFKAIQAKRHSAALSEDGRLFVWGQVFNNDQPLLLPQELKSNKAIIQISIGDNISAIIDEDQHVYSWGTENHYGQLGRSEDNSSEETGFPQIIESLIEKQVTQICVGSNFCIALGLDFDDYGNPTKQSYKISEQQKHDKYNNQNNREYQQYGPSDNQEQVHHYEHEDNRKDQRVPHASNTHQNQVHKQDQFEYVPRSQYAQKPDVAQISQQSSKQSFVDKYDSNRGDPATDSQRQFENRRNYDSNQNLNERPRSTTPTYGSQQYQPNQSPINQGVPTQPMQNSASAYIPGQTSSNVELYKQLDQLRQENFELKQKQRELIQGLNLLKLENEQLLVHTDEEIKRMSDFVDKFTAEVDITKKQIEDEYQEKLRAERLQNEENNRKMHQEQQSISIKLDKMEKEIELLRKENSGLKQDKTQMNEKYSQSIEQLERTQQKLKQAENQITQLQSIPRENTMSPQQLNNKVGYQRQDDYQQNPVGTRTPGGYNSRPPVANSNPNERSIPTTQYRRNEETLQQSQYQTIKSEMNNNSYSKFQLDGGDKSAQKQGNYNNDYSAIREDRSQTIEQKGDYSPFNGRGAAARQQQQQYSDKYDNSQITATPNRYNQNSNNYQANSTIYSPMRQQREPAQVQNNLQYSQSRENGARYRNYQNQEQQQQNYVESQTQKDNQDINSYYQQRQFSQNINVPPRTDYSNNKKDAQLYSSSMSPNQQLQNSSYQRYEGASLRQKTPPRASDEKNPKLTHSEITSPPQEQPIVEKSSALNDVKNRLMIMQKNKEELEEKLKNYEAKIRQHFNKP